MPERVQGPKVIEFWYDSVFWANGEPAYSNALRGVYTRHQLIRPMNNKEYKNIYGWTTITGEPWIGKERCYSHSVNNR